MVKEPNQCFCCRSIWHCWRNKILCLCLFYLQKFNDGFIEQSVFRSAWNEDANSEKQKRSLCFHFEAFFLEEKKASSDAVHPNPYDPTQVENQCLQGKHVFHLQRLVSSRNTHLSLSLHIVWASPQLASSCLPLKVLLTSFSVAPVPSLMSTDSLFHLPSPITGSLDQFSVWLNSLSPLWLPRPSHLSLTLHLFTSLQTHPKSIWLAMLPELGELVSFLLGLWVGYGTVSHCQIVCFKAFKTMALTPVS